ncbi:MAG: hypothetical protein ACREND_08005 [Gemmatimonadaceae bacterium]
MRRLALILVATAAACSSSTGPKTPAFVGTWDLVSVDGAPLPETVATVVGTGAAFLLQDATLVLTGATAGDSLVTDFRISTSATIIPSVDHVAALGNGTELEWLDRSDSTDAITVHGDTLLLTTSRLALSSHTFMFERATHASNAAARF